MDAWIVHEKIDLSLDDRSHLRDVRTSFHSIFLQIATVGSSLIADSRSLLPAANHCAMIKVTETFPAADSGDAA